MSTRRTGFKTFAFFIFSYAALFTGQAGAGTGSSLTLTPSTGSLSQGQKQQFTVSSSNGTTTDVYWTMVPSLGTMVNGLYTAPAYISSQITVTLIATLNSDPTVSGSATISLVPPTGNGSQSFSVLPPTVNLSAGQSWQFTAIGVSGAISWSLLPPVGTISSNGLYKAPASIPSPQNVTVIASKGSNSAMATVFLAASAPVISNQPPPPPPPTANPTSSGGAAITPSTAALSAQQTIPFQFSINSRPISDVIWSLSPPIGMLNNGVYTAPFYISSQMTVTLTGISASNSNKNATAIITLLPPAGTAPPPPPPPPPPSTISISVTPSATALGPSQTATFASTVTGSTNTAATWSMSPSVGTLNNGVYTAPSTITSAQTVTIMATSSADSTKTASASVSLTPPPPPTTLSVSPAQVSLGPSGAQQFTASTSSNVGGSAPPSVTWSISPPAGTISSTGLYTAPSTISTAQTVTVTATGSGVAATATVSLAPPQGLTISPTQVSLYQSQGKQFSAALTGSTSNVTWSINPSVGTISSSGMYTAPSTITSSQPVTVTVSGGGLTANATVNLVAPSLSVSPGQVSLNASQTQQFSAALTGASSTVTWSVSPAVGSISASGLYTAPSSNTTQQTVTITATAGSLTATSSVSLVPQASLSISPAQVTLNASQGQQFSATLTGSSASVTWSVSPAVGSITQSGQYTAPSSISLQQSVTVTATAGGLTATATVTLKPAVSLTLGPTQVTLNASQGQLFSATLTGSSSSVTWSVSPTVGSISASGLYTAPASVATQQTVTVTASAAGLTATAAVTLAPPSSPPAQSQIVLPIEVLGANGTTTSVSFTPSAGVNLGAAMNMNLTIHGLRYNTQAMVQINSSGWTPINSATATVLGLGANYGGIGGAFSTLNLQMNIPANTLVAGTNTVTFQFVATDGVVSGYRVLAVNFTDAGGNTAIPSSSFVWDNPANWTPVSSAASDIAAGQTLFQTGSLVDNVGGPNPNQPIQAHCSDCHFVDGSDLQYFGYSNNSIIARSQFHGLTAAQGAQIASYIRSLKVAITGRPWNPPFQPGPGLDSLPVQSWMAGAGLSAVLSDDSGMVPYLMPGGDTSQWAPTAFLNQRQMPIPMQLPDWNRYLPRVHPMDAWGGTFTSSQLLTNYQSIKSSLASGGVGSFEVGGFYNLQLQTSLQQQLIAPLRKPSTDPSWSNPAYVYSLMGIARWTLVKDLEIYFQYDLWDPSVVSKVFSTPDAAGRAIQWGSLEFMNSSNMLQIPIANNMNGLQGSFNGESMSWYYAQLVTNEGNNRGPNQPSVDDIGYILNFLNADSWGIEKPLPTGVQTLYWLIKTLQMYQGDNPSYGNAGWNLNNNRAYYLVIGQNLFPSSVSQSTQVQLFNGYLNYWIQAITSFSNAQWLAGYANGWGPNPATDVITPGNPTAVQAGGGSGIAYMLPIFRYLGVNSNTLQQTASWAASIWPTYNWQGRLNASCTPSGEIASCQ